MLMTVTFKDSVVSFCFYLQFLTLLFAISDIFCSWTVRELGESYVQKLAILRGMHAKQWGEFLQFDVQRRQQACQHLSAPTFGGGYKHPGFSDYDHTSSNPAYTGNNLPIDSRGRYPCALENYPTKAHDTCGEFQRQRHEDFGKAYHRH
uniref:Uncharacterized protein n=1 Tax=Nelumbo nucifera TaxID=4432 RepID=A0A822Z9V5_NELNU|nr:TPA_asm: hypothetical protein HUJ06_008949 [Nelumbo nucifera]